MCISICASLSFTDLEQYSMPFVVQSASGAVPEDPVLKDPVLGGSEEDMYSWMQTLRKSHDYCRQSCGCEGGNNCRTESYKCDTENVKCHKCHTDCLKAEIKKR